jgi:hypothetical protein
MMEKSAQAGEGGGCRPTPFHYIYNHKVVAYALADREDTLPLFLLYPVYVLCGKNNKGKGETGGPFLI